jgi:hypothetical protein
MQIHGFRQAILTPVEYNILEILPDFGVRLKAQGRSLRPVLLQVKHGSFGCSIIESRM